MISNNNFATIYDDTIFIKIIHFIINIKTTNSTFIFNVLFYYYCCDVFHEYCRCIILVHQYKREYFFRCDIIEEDEVGCYFLVEKEGLPALIKD